MFISFANPKYLYLLFVIPIMLFFHFYSLKHLKGKSLQFANFEAIARVKGIDLYSKNIFILIVDILIISLLIFSISGLTVHKIMVSSEFSYVIAFDNSESMGATDINPTRLEASKLVANEFLDTLPEYSKVGIITFSGNSYIKEELTDNRGVIKGAISGIDLSGVGGTDLYEAISTSYSILKDEENKAVIILSDGQINTGKVEDILQNEKFNKMIVHTIAIGTKEGGETKFGISKLDEETLKALSFGTGGKSFNINSKEELKNSFSQIIPLTKKEGSKNYSYILMIATLILFLYKQFLIQIKGISI
ncbi:MAG: VWA domain-containing protein [Candidatus Pacearchaeota archaeon]|jgi:Ca-activated chloride channel family protein